MARALTLRLGEATFAFEMGAKVDKRALYGYARRIAEKDGKALSHMQIQARSFNFTRRAIWTSSACSTSRRRWSG